ncbi:glycosyltransferase [Pseudorhodobacter sp. MZDSW-24AT]|uniref:glycosyltransferase n=1 Tax=Pseudorhodobacter sp. MZDSW-24AT TaxID=2052957 RepID=UPI000C1E0BB8|nr:glycosyltransferase [Pseudorhodobacter sp. MZDSW-24AT]PJF10625.1 glycosyl transferase [Pseudorhodobacter sp. MZDSW-24AT]
MAQIFLSPRSVSLPDGAIKGASVSGERQQDTLALTLLRGGLVQGDDMIRALMLQTYHRRPVSDILLARKALPTERFYTALAQRWGTQVIDPVTAPPDIRLIDQLGAVTCLRQSVLPWRKAGGATIIAASDPQDFADQRELLTRIFGPVALAITTPSALRDSLFNLRGRQLAHAAETRVAPVDSCRTLSGTALRRLSLLVACCLVMLSFAWPALVLWVMTGWTFLTLLLTALLKAACGLASKWRRVQKPAFQGPPPAPAVSIIVALYGESDIAGRLVRRLGKLEYPRDRLDIVLAVEAEDQKTRSALAKADLPPWMQIVVVPKGQIKTKPRALNFAVDHCRGSIIGVYDAEDAPEPDQILRVVERFSQLGPEVACLQGVLDFYNPSTNWLSRCFTIEYATWFRLILPGLARLGLPIPLGGTTLFFRREALERLGGWDAHNVTEDADLGIRLYRHGYRTELIDTVTGEEANCHTLPWIKQRSRWLKGYMMTWATHMRDPVKLWRDLGAWKFLGFQVLLLCTLSQFVFAPLLWSFWLPWFGVSHPIADALPPALILFLLGLLLITEVINLTLHLCALHISGHRFSRWWVLMMHAYFPLGALASYKAAWEMVRNPFYWDKTMHGRFDPI